MRAVGWRAMPSMTRSAGLGVDCPGGTNACTLSCRRSGQIVRTAARHRLRPLHSPCRPMLRGQRRRARRRRGMPTPLQDPRTATPPRTSAVIRLGVWRRLPLTFAHRVLSSSLRRPRAQQMRRQPRSWTTPSCTLHPGPTAASMEGTAPAVQGATMLTWMRAGWNRLPPLLRCSRHRVRLRRMRRRSPPFSPPSPPSKPSPPIQRR